MNEPTSRKSACSEDSASAGGSSSLSARSPDMVPRRSGPQQAVDGRFALAVTADQFCAECVEPVVTAAPIVGDATLERRQLLLQRGQLGLRQLLQATEPVLGADAVELLRQGIVADVVDGARRTWRTARQMGGQHDAELAREILTGLTAIAAVLLGTYQIDARLRDAANVRDLVVLHLQTVAKRPQLVER